MKISSAQVQPFDQFPGKGHANRNKAAEPSAFANISDAATANQAKAISAAHAGRKEIPPGLERVQARLQATPAEDLSKGQINALDRISRNIARYLEVQAMATPEQTAAPNPVDPPAEVTEPPVAEVAVEEPAPAMDNSAGTGSEIVITEPAANSETT